MATQKKLNEKNALDLEKNAEKFLSD